MNNDLKAFLRIILFVIILICLIATPQILKQIIFYFQTLSEIDWAIIRDVIIGVLIVIVGLPISIWILKKAWDSIKP